MDEIDLAEKMALEAIAKAKSRGQLIDRPVHKTGENLEVLTKPAHHNSFQSNLLNQGVSNMSTVSNGNGVKIIAGVFVIIGLLINQYAWFVHDTQKQEYNNTAAGLGEIAIRKIQVEAKLREQTSESGSSGTVGHKTLTKAVPMFDCRTIEKRDAGFVSESVQTLDRSDVAYVLSPGCTRVTMTGQMADSITTLQAGGSFIFQKKDTGSPSGYVGCGTMNGRNDIPSSCLSYLKIRAGEVFEVINANQDIILK